MARGRHGDLIGVHVRAAEGLAGPPPGLLDAHRKLLEDLGGTYHEVAGADPADTLVAFARAEHATQLVLGASRRSRASELLRGSVINRVVRASGDIDVHVISRPAEGEPTANRGPRTRLSLGLSRRRQMLGLAIALTTLPAMTIVLTQTRENVSFSSALILFLLLVVVIAAVGGAWVGIASAIVAFLLVNWYFTPPVHTWTISNPDHFLALVVFLIVAAVVSVLVTVAARRELDAARARNEAGSLVTLAGSLLTDADPLPGIMQQLLTTFALRSVAVLRPQGEHEWQVVASAGDAPVADPHDATATAELPDDAVFAYVGPSLTADDRRVLNAFVAQLAVALSSRELRAEAAKAASLTEADALRTGLLRAVSHDLRTPLASIKASVTTLLADDLTLDDDTKRQLETTIDEEADRLNDLVTNLLAMSRLQVGRLDLARSDVALGDIVARALVSLGDRAASVEVDVPESLPRLIVDPALLERAVANVVENALAWSPDGRPVRIEAGAVRDAVILRVVDRGPGIPPAQRDQVFQPFQRLNDSGGGGVGLGLAVARGFAESIGGSLHVDDTPGGGTTMVFRLPATCADDGAS
jgi:two-component system sensor histidine kinase KdpD